MRAAALAFFCLATPAAAWDFAETKVCTLSHDATDMAVEITFDPATGIYAITLLRAVGTWPVTPSFRLQFDGPFPLVIGTDRHVLSAGGRGLTVSDTGFGNVLNGIGLNDLMTARAGEVVVSAATTGAAEAVAAFRACPSAPTS